ncbi:MAG: Kae1-associated kinase Bud32 [Thermofilum sp.]
MASVEPYLKVLQEMLDLKVRRVLGIGAEALLVEGDLNGLRVVVKYRVPKEYRDPALDTQLRRQRTSLEAKLLCKAAEAGVRVPDVVYVDGEEGVLVLSYVQGTRMKELIDRAHERVAGYARELGLMVGRLHEHGIIHGDLTTSNVVISGDSVYLIDFGLGFFSKRVEDAGVDLHLFRRALESTHPGLVGLLYAEFVNGYREAREGERAEEVLRKAEEIRLRGRYVSERRLKAFWKG